MKRQHVVYLTTLALLAALTIIFGTTPLGMLNLGVVYVTLLCLPVIIGAIALGAKGGVILAVVFGCVSFFTGLNAPSALVAPILGASVFYVAALCFMPRVCIPLVTHAVYRIAVRKNETAALIIAPLCGSMTNTVLYMGLMVVLYKVIGLDAAPILAAVVSTVAVASIVEAIVAVAATLPIIKALKKAGLLRLRKA